ncbi:hypothetical protein [Oleisolibacter albus]|uniref:hypothetical protein n=1 Tax=Oleisolibacter albus TaxID=2171757 RepID=UPI0012D7CEAC|nr:hypothetical protein [Oleisolibacter albus]
MASFQTVHRLPRRRGAGVYLPPVYRAVMPDYFMLPLGVFLLVLVEAAAPPRRGAKFISIILP